jgi:uncharacterized phage protein (TIGR02220 family)
MDDQKPSYFSILPALVRYDKELTPLSKLLFSEITALSNKTGRAYPTNKYLAELYNCSTKTISASLSLLESKDFIIIEIEKNKKGTYRSIIPLVDPINKNLQGGRKKPPGGKKKTSTPIEENFHPKEYYKINNTSNNNKEIETEKKPLPFLSDLRKVLSTFEELTGFRAKVPAEGKIKAYGAYKLVKARREEGYSLEELINVVRFKCGEWMLKDKMRQYCNYNTILRKSNFEKYLQEVNIIQTTKTKTFSNDKINSKKRDLRAELGEILKKGRQSGYL